MSMSTARRCDRTPLTTRLLAAATLVLAAVAAPAAWALEPFSADYSARFMGMEADGKMTLENVGGDRWEYRMEAAGMARKGTRPSRNAETASSLAAFRTAGTEPPRSSAS